MKKVLITLILFNLHFGHVSSIEPEIFVQSTVNRASNVLSKDISKEEKMNQLTVIAKETVDIKGVGFYSLGSARKNLDDVQKIKYSELFESYFLKSFSSRLSEYSNQKIEVQNIVKTIRKIDKELIVGIKLFDVFEGKKAYEQIGNNKKSLAFEVILQSKDRTLIENEIEELSQKIISNVTDLTGGSLR